MISTFAGRSSDEMREHEFEATRHLHECSDRPTGKLGNCLDNGRTKNADMSPTLALSHNLAGVQPTSIACACRQTLDVALSPAERTHAAALTGERSRMRVWRLLETCPSCKGKWAMGRDIFCWSSTRLAKGTRCSLTPQRTHAHKNPVFVTWCDSAWAVCAKGK